MSKERNLINNRDTAWKIYTTATSELESAIISTKIPEPRVRIIELAIKPDTAIAPNKMMNIGMALILGLISGVFFTFVSEFFENLWKHKSKSGGGLV